MQGNCRATTTRVIIAAFSGATRELTIRGFPAVAGAGNTGTVPEACANHNNHHK
jgi:hypothetical protein